MFLRRRPRDEDIRAFIAAQADLSFSYAEVGATRTDPPSGYTVDHHRVSLGHGAATFARAVDALRGWRMFSIDGIELCWPTAPIAVGTTVAILAGDGGLWALNACRIVYVVDDADQSGRFGFAYGTLPEHAVCGEERFLIERSRESDEVFYDVLAFSRPSSLLLAFARPLLRRAQRRFARGSLAGMRRAVAVEPLHDPAPTNRP
jgi:uncharacterized protein (UPF0548 family)